MYNNIKMDKFLYLVLFYVRMNVENEVGKMRLNNKGFSLIEILSVILILSIILAIAIPNTTYSIKKGESKISSINDEVILSSANLYVEEFQVELNWYMDNNLRTTCFSTYKLEEKGYLTNDNLKSYSDKYIKVVQNNGLNSYYFTDTCNNL